MPLAGIKKRLALSLKRRTSRNFIRRGWLKHRMDKGVSGIAFVTHKQKRRSVSGVF
jgi:hypothetical protein